MEADKDEQTASGLSTKGDLQAAAATLLDFYSKNRKLVKLVSSRIEAFDVEISDAKFAGRHYEEEKAYVDSRDLREYLRRGNSLLKIGGGKDEKTVVARRGIAKFFDLLKEHVDVLALKEGKADVKDLEGSMKATFRVIIEPAIDALLKEKTVIVYKTEKANGENCQVTYIQELDTWLVSSKNVAVIFKTEKDFAQYVDGRYMYALEMARTWLALIGKVANVQAIRDVLKQYTAIGEYCGNDNFQHFVDYPEETILFYALVPKSIRDGVICAPPSVALKTFKDLQLPVVGHETFPPCTNLKDFAAAMRAAYYDTATKSLKEVGEGLVMYISVVDTKEGAQSERVVSLCKTKSVEYRIFRRIREKLKGKADAFAKIGPSLEELETKFGKPPQSIDYYVKVALKAKAVLASLNTEAKSACSKFKDLLHLSIKCTDEDRLPSKAEIEAFHAKKADGGEDEEEDEGVKPQASTKGKQKEIEEDDN